MIRVVKESYVVVLLLSCFYMFIEFADVYLRVLLDYYLS